jgi:hypothetical protein
MSVAGSYTPPGAAGTASSVHAWRCAAALGLGAPDTVAQRFGETGLAEFSGKPLSLQPLHVDPSGPWLAVTGARRPAGMSEDEWCDALLLATSACSAATHAAFGLDDDGDGAVLLRIPAGHEHPDLLAAELACLLGLRQAVEQVTKSEAPAKAQAPQPKRLQAAPPLRTRAAPTQASPLPDPDIQEFEAPEQMLDLVYAAAVELGFSREQAIAVARSGSLEIDGVPVGLACDDTGLTLVVAAQVAAAALDTPARRRLALQANVHLMATAGVALARDRGQARLVSRCGTEGQSAADLAAWLKNLADLSRAIAEQRGAQAGHAH